MTLSDGDMAHIKFDPDPVIEAYKAHIDRTLVRENLRRTVEVREDGERSRPRRAAI